MKVGVLCIKKEGVHFDTPPYFVIFIKSITRLHYLCNGNFKTGSCHMIYINTRTSFGVYRVFLGIKHVSLSNQRRFKDVQGCL